MKLRILSYLSLLLVSMAVAQNPDNGKRLYVKNGCFECHGYEGQGGAARTRLSGTKMMADTFQTFIRNPPPGDMPPYKSKVMTNEELADVWAYLRTFPASRSWKDIPLLQF
jgi:mono/diheme cytochrome c family protein